MSKFLWETNRQPKMMKVKVRTTRPQQVLLAVYDWKKPNTYYSKQIVDVHGKDEFEISLPFTPQKVFFEAKVVGSGNMPLGFNGGLEVQPVEVPFHRPMECQFSTDPTYTDFMKLILFFAENAGILSASYGNKAASIYRSPTGRFQISYVPTIIDDQEYLDEARTVKNPGFGFPSPTSFRVNAVEKGKMEVAQNYAVDYTFPQRVALGVHEGGHDFINEDPESEEEADMHAVLICRCLGFSKREIGQAFTKVFMRYPSPQNAQRALLVQKQLENMK